MNALFPTWISILGWALIDFLWQGMLVGMAAVIVLMLLRNARPQTRYAVCCAALALCLALPVIGMWRGLHVDVSIVAMDVPAMTDSVAGIPAQVTLAPLLSWQTPLQAQLPWIVALWSLGSGLLALRMSLGMLWVNRIGRMHSGTIDTAWQARLDRLAQAFGMHRCIRLRVVHSALDSPAASGIWRPMVLLPAALIARMPTELLEALLAHELAHIKRHDYLLNLIQCATEALLFYHPVVWWLSRQVRVEREQIADDMAAHILGEPRRLALALQELDRLQFDGYPIPRLIPAANGGNLMSRIQRLIRPNQHALSWRMALPIIGLTAACLTVYAHDTTPASASPAAAPVTATSTTHSAVHATNTTPATASTTATAATTSSAAIAEPSANTARHGIHIINNAHRNPDAYAVVRDGQSGISMSGDSRDVPAIDKIRQRMHGDFVWTRHDGKAYVVQDPAIVATVVEAWQPSEALGKRMDALSAQMEIPSQRMEALGKRMEALSQTNNPYSAAMEHVSAQIEALGQQQQAIGTKLEALGNRIEQADAVQRESLEPQMEALQARMEPLDRQMEKLGSQMQLHSQEMSRSQQPMQDLARQMEEASKPMQELGKQMEALGKQQELLTREADRAVKAAIEAALRNGKGVPVDGATPD